MTALPPFVALLALAATQAGASERPWTVRQVIENAELLDGREVIVAGWLQACQRLSCPLFNSPEEAKGQSPAYHLSVGGNGWFDHDARRYAPSYVILKARVDARCINDPSQDVIALCTDRPSSLRPVRIIHWGK
jgi:hypothetical protein